MTNEVRGEPSKQSERVQLANDPQIEETQLRQKEGIPTDDYFLRKYQKLSFELDVEMVT